MRRPVRSSTRARATEQRREPTRAEEAFWRDLRGRRLGGAKFRRQVPIGPYVIDFVCFQSRLIVELDGPPHEDVRQQAHDLRRDRWLTGQGFRVLRFPNDLILGGSGELVLRAIRTALAADPSSDLR